MPLNVEQIRAQAQAALDEANTRLDALRAEKANIQAAIKTTVAERDDAARIVKKLAPPKPKAEPVIEDLNDVEDAESAEAEEVA